MKGSKRPVHIMARIMFEENKSSEEHRLTMFDDVLEKITEGVGGTTIADKLFNTPEIKLSVNRQDVILSAAEL